MTRKFTAEPEDKLNSWRLAYGFSLIEMMAVLAILAILASAAIPMTQLAVQHSKEQQLQVSLRQLREAIDAYKRAADEGRIAKKVGESGYPRSLDDLVRGVEDLRDANKAKIYFLRRIPTDPMAPQGLVGAESWRKRSYVSPPDDPKEGDDVFDVFSRNENVGLNGISYQKW
jgi:general secretion pathway protein G